MKKALKIKAPVNSINSTKEQINAGADEIYLGLFSPEWFANLSFSHRGISNLQTDVAGCLKTQKDLVEIVEIAHSQGVKVSYTANFFNLADTPINEANNKDLSTGYLDYVKIAIDSGVDTVIIANINQALLIKKAGLNIPLSASCLFMCSNEYYYHILKSLGIKSFVLPHDTNFLVMEKFVSLNQQKENKCEIGIFGHFSCGMLSGGCHWYHKFGESIDLGYPCRNEYFVSSSGEGKDRKRLPIFNFNSDCSICQLSEIIKIGIDSIKIVGKSSSSNLISKITRIYRWVIDNLKNNANINDIHKELLQKESWWANMYCKNKSCKYSRNNIYNEYAIG